MADVIDALVAFALFGITIYVLLGSVSTIHSVNVGDCAPGVNGTLENCSLSDNDYALLNKTETAYSQTFGVITPLVWLFVAGVVVGAVVLLSSLRRG